MLNISTFLTPLSDWFLEDICWAKIKRTIDLKIFTIYSDVYQGEFCLSHHRFAFLTEIVFNCDSLHGSLNSHYEALSYTKRLQHTGNLFRKNLQLKDVLILDLKSLRS